LYFNEERKVDNKEIITPTDLVGAILSLIKREYDIRTITTDSAKIHSLFYQLRENENFHSIIHLEFDTSDMYPYSSTLEEALLNLQLTRDLSRENIDLTEYIIKDSIKYYESAFNDEEMESLKLIAEEVNKMQPSLK
jgi:hypothetical protein